MGSIVFNKPAFSIQDQIKLLSARGLLIKDIALAEHWLTHVGYYRLAGYWQIFQTDGRLHTFAVNTTFEQIVELYNFDRELRMLVYDAIERIEVSLRTIMVQYMSLVYGPYWFVNAGLAHYPDHYEENKLKIEEEIGRSKEQFIVHHDEVYGKSNFPPAWKTMQVLSLGTLSKVYSNISTALPEKNQIARSFGLPNYVYFVSWMQSVTILRNLCAHHSRICNRMYDFVPQRLSTMPYPWISRLPANMHFSRMLYNQLCSLKYLLDRVCHGNTFSARLHALIALHPGIAVRQMGFVDDWNKEPLWE
ncbi:Abi family protein [Chitinophaga filiformis]|uniref:Abi family protein n=1 Tax=Chitinophaga filiformis TaxID=104663 RepID=A0ABY4HYJ0_CHIFI|nr:Abi family protein [Chitinophaga filiformis]UPK68886.1 Abi family protein [Chitinophaga filiformis]